MRQWLLVLALAMSCGTPVASANETRPAAVTSFDAVAAELGPQLQTGSLLFNKGDCLAIRIYTASPYTHVAIVVVENGQPLVFDSQNGFGVRRQSLTHYLVSQSPDLLHVFHPQRPLTAEQGRALADYLESELGRPYAVAHHLTGRRAEGVHCAEYVTDALMSIELLHAQRPSRVSPASLVTGITRAGIYTAETTLELDPPVAAAPVAANRCHQLWIDTKHCTAKCCDKLAGWFLCR